MHVKALEIYIAHPPSIPPHLSLVFVLFQPVNLFQILIYDLFAFNSTAAYARSCILYLCGLSIYFIFLWWVTEWIGVWVMVF